MKSFYSFSGSQLWGVLLLTVGLGLPLLTAKAACAAEESATGAVTSDGTSGVSELAILEQRIVLGDRAYAMEMADGSATGDDFDSDPWEPFNDKMFWFNREVLDRFLIKPIATAWDFVLPDQVQRSIHNALDNLAVVRRVVNNALQLKLTGAAKEVARFTINSTVGIVGLFDVAREGFGIDQSDEDTGQTFGVWGIGPGPYLVLPFLPPLTVRDGIGYAFDAAMTPYVYFVPWYASFSGTATNTANERSINLDRFERVAETTVDLYSAVRNAYLQRRAAAIRQ